MALLNITITDAGKAELINAQNSGTNAVTITHIGLGTGKYLPDQTQTALINQTKQLNSISGLATNNNTIHITIKDESQDVYNVSEIGLFTDKGTLFAIYSDTTDFLQKTGTSTLLIALDIAMTSTDVSIIEFGNTSFINPAASESTLGVAKIATTQETTAGTNNTKIVTPLRLKQRIDLLQQTLSPSKTFYIDSVIGNDNNDGLTLATAFKTIKKGCDSVPVGAAGTLLLQNGQIFDITENILISSKLISASPVDIENVNRPLFRYAYTQNPAIYGGGVTYASIAGFNLQNSLFISKHCNHDLHNPNNVDLTQPIDSGGGMFTTWSASGNPSVSIGNGTIDLGSLHPVATCVMGSVSYINVILFQCNVIGSGYVTRNQAVATLNKNFYSTTIASTVIIN